MYSTVVTLNLKHLEIMFNYGEIIDQHTKHSTIILNFMIWLEKIEHAHFKSKHILLV